jgi:hypothetical protein
MNPSKQFIDEMWNTNVTFQLNNQAITMTMKEMHDNYDVDEHTSSIVPRVAEGEGEMFRYISASPYNVLNYELVNNEFVLKYAPHRKALKYEGRM